MKKIPINGKHATRPFVMIDDDDYESMSGYCWHAHKVGRSVYARCHNTESTPRRLYMHRLLLKAPVGVMVDHVNGDGLDNRRDNIRLCDKSQNNANQQKTRGSSLYKGAYWCPRHSRWRAFIKADGKAQCLGYFKREEDAALAYNFAAMEKFGDFARLNVASDMETINA
jgi:HNH endonuclease